MSPNINVILNMLEPTMLPRASLVFFLRAAVTDAASSGRDVPHAISVIDMNASLTPNDLAIFMAFDTKRSQLTASIARPATVLADDIHRGAASSWTGSCSGLFSCRGKTNTT